MNSKVMTEMTMQADLNATDIRILDQLQSDASISNQELAARVHTSPATCLRRVRRLVQMGLIERRIALIGADWLSRAITAISEVTLDRQGAEHLRAFETRAISHAAVQQCYRVAPGPDFVLVAFAADMAEWGDVVDDLFTQDANVRNVKTYFSVKRTKFEPRVPASTLAGTQKK